MVCTVHVARVRQREGWCVGRVKLQSGSGNNGHSVQVPKGGVSNAALWIVDIDEAQHTFRVQVPNLWHLHLTQKCFV